MTRLNKSTASHYVNGHVTKFILIQQPCSLFLFFIPVSDFMGVTVMEFLSDLVTTEKIHET